MEQYAIDVSLVQSLLQSTQQPSIERMGGLSNFVYKVTSEGKSLIYRIYSDYFEIFQDRMVETQIQQELSKSSLAPRILYQDSHKRIEEYLPYESVSGLQLKQDYLHIAKLLGRVHAQVHEERMASILSSPSQRVPCIKRHLCNERLQKEVEQVLATQVFTSKSLKEVFARVFSPSVQECIAKLFASPCLSDLVFCHNDLNSTNFLRDESGRYHILDWEGAGLNYPGYEIANFFNELTWDYTVTTTPFFKVDQSNGLTEEEVEKFLQGYWHSYTNSDDKYPAVLIEQIRIGRILQNYYWLMIGVLSLKFKNTELQIDLVEYIRTRVVQLECDINQVLW